MEPKLLDDGVLEQSLIYFDLISLSAYFGYEEHIAVLKYFAQVCILILLCIQSLLNSGMYLEQNFAVGIAYFEAADFAFVHFNKSFLGQDVVEWILIEKQRLDELEESLRIELDEPFQELVCGDESHDVEHVHSPFERG